MKATVEIPDDLYRDAKARAALSGRKVKDLVADGLRRVLYGEAAAPPRGKRISLPVVRSRKPGALKLTGEMIADFEARADAGSDD
jgi:hypothetical protein